MYLLIINSYSFVNSTYTTGMTSVDSAGVKEIRDWLTAPGHESEVLIINVNDFSKDHDWGHIPLIQDPIKDLFGEMIFSPNDKQKYYPNRWYKLLAYVCSM